MTKKPVFGVDAMSCCRVARKLKGIKCPVCMRDITKDPEVLDCGHDAKPDGIKAGYATRADGTRICYDCADREQVEALKTADTFVGYLSNGPQGKQTSYRLTTWTGGHLATVGTLVRRDHNIGGFLYYINAIDAHGQQWHGTSPGPGMYARMRKNKVQTRKYAVVWSPEGKTIAQLWARSAQEAKRKALRGTPYRKYPGEVYVEDITTANHFVVA